MSNSFFSEEHDEVSIVDALIAITAAGGAAIPMSNGSWWKPWLHPRDRFGRFIETFSQVKFSLKTGGETNDATGRVNSIDPDGGIWIDLEEALSQEAKARFGQYAPGTARVKVDKKDIEVLDAKARINKARRGFRKLTKNQETTLRARADELRSKGRNGGAPDDLAVQAADAIDEFFVAYDQLAANVGKMGGRNNPTVIAVAANTSDMLEKAANLIDELGGRGHKEGDDRTVSKGDIYDEFLHSTFSRLLTARAQMEGAVKGRNQLGGEAQGQDQVRGDLSKDILDTSGLTETGVVYLDPEGNVLPDPKLQKKKADANKSAEDKAITLTDEERLIEIATNGGFDTPPAVNGLDRLAQLFNRHKKAVGDRSADDKFGDTLVPGSIVQVDEGTGRGGGFTRPSFVGVVKRIHNEKTVNGARIQDIEVVDYRPDLLGTPPEEQDPNIDPLYYEQGFKQYRVRGQALENITPEGENNFAVLMAEFGDKEFNKEFTRLAQDIAALGGERRLGGMNARRLSEIAKNGAIPVNQRRRIDANGRLVGVGDWVFVPRYGTYGEVTYIEPNSDTMRVNLPNVAGGDPRVSASSVAFAHGPNNPVFNRPDIDNALGSGMYAPTRAEAAAVARRQGFTEAADVIDAGGSAEEIRAALEAKAAWGVLAAQVLQTRSRMFDRGQRGLNISLDDTNLLQDGAIISAAFSGRFRESDATPKAAIEIPEPSALDIPDSAPESALPENFDLPEGSKAILNPENPSSVLVADSSGNVTEFLPDPATGDYVDTQELRKAETPEVLPAAEAVPGAYERRSNGNGKPESYYTPDGKYKVTPNKKGGLVVTDVSDPTEPDVVGVVDTWDEVNTTISAESPSSLPSNPSEQLDKTDVYAIREEAARADLSEALGIDVTQSERQEIVDSSEYADIAAAVDSSDESAKELAKIDANLAEIAASDALKSDGEHSEVGNIKKYAESLGLSPELFDGVNFDNIDEVFDALTKDPNWRQISADRDSALMADYRKPNENKIMQDFDSLRDAIDRLPVGPSGKKFGNLYIESKTPAAKTVEPAAPAKAVDVPEAVEPAPEKSRASQIIDRLGTINLLKSRINREIANAGGYNLGEEPLAKSEVDAIIAEAQARLDALLAEERQLRDELKTLPVTPETVDLINNSLEKDTTPAEPRAKRFWTRRKGGKGRVYYDDDQGNPPPRGQIGMKYIQPSFRPADPQNPDDVALAKEMNENKTSAMLPSDKYKLLPEQAPVAKKKRQLTEDEINAIGEDTKVDQGGDLPQVAPQVQADTREPVAPGDTSVAENIAGGLESLIERLKRDKVISDKAAEDAITEIFNLEDAIEVKNPEAYYNAINRIVRNNGLPEQLRQTIGRDITAIKRNGGIFGEETEVDSAAKLTDRPSLNLTPVKYKKVDGAPEEFADDLESVYAALDSYNSTFEAGRGIKDDLRAAQGFKPRDLAAEDYSDSVRDLLNNYNKLKKVLTDPDSTEDQKLESLALMYDLLALKTEFAIRNNVPDIEQNNLLYKNRAARLRSKYSTEAKSVDIAGEDTADALHDESFFNTVSGNEPGQFNIVDANGEPLDTAFAAEYPETRLVLGQGDVTQDEFNDFWDSVVRQYFGETGGSDAAFFITVDDNGDTVLSAGTWTEDESNASAVANANGDMYFDASTGEWKDPADFTDGEEEQSWSFDLNDEQKSAVNTLITSLDSQGIDTSGLADLVDGSPVSDSNLLDVASYLEDYISQIDVIENPSDEQINARDNLQSVLDGINADTADSGVTKDSAMESVRSLGSPVYTESAGGGTADISEIGATVDVVKRYTPSPEASALFESAGISTSDFLEITDSEAFYNAASKIRNDGKFGSSVTLRDNASEYDGLRLFLSEDGGAGFALDGDELVSAFSNGSGANAGSGDALVQLAIQQGARRLDAFDTVLPELYARSGFVITGRTPFNEEFAPEGWNYDTYKNFNGGRPDVVFMAYDPSGSITGGERQFDSYDAASENNKKVVQSLNSPAPSAPSAPKKLAKFKATAPQISALVDGMSSTRGPRAQALLRMLKGEDAPTADTLDDAFTVINTVLSEIQDIIENKPDWADIPAAKRQKKSLDALVSKLESIDFGGDSMSPADAAAEANKQLDDEIFTEQQNQLVERFNRVFGKSGTIGKSSLFPIDYTVSEDGLVTLKDELNPFGFSPNQLKIEPLGFTWNDTDKVWEQKIPDLQERYDVLDSLNKAFPPEDGDQNGKNDGPSTPGGGDGGGFPRPGSGGSGGGGTPDQGGPAGPGEPGITTFTSDSVDSLLSDKAKTPVSTIEDIRVAPPEDPNLAEPSDVYAVAGSTPQSERTANKQKFVSDLGEMSIEDLRTAIGLSPAVDMNDPVAVRFNDKLKKMINEAKKDASERISRDMAYMAAFFAQSVLSGLGPQELQGERGDLIREFLRQSFGFNATTNPLTPEERASLTDLFDLAAGNNFYPLNRLEMLNRLIATNDLNEISFWNDLNNFRTFATEAKEKRNIYTEYMTDEEVSQQYDAINAVYESAASRVTQLEFSAPTEAMPELGLAETAPGEDSLAAVAKSILELGPDLGTREGIREAMGNENQVTFPNGLTITQSGFDDELGGGINSDQTFLVRTPNGEKYVLKYDSPGNALAEVVAARAIRGSGGLTPEVVPLSTEAFSGNGGENKDVGFLQNWAGSNEELKTFGDGYNTDKFVEVVTEAKDSPELQGKLVEEFARTILAVFAGNRFDIHPGNYVAAEDANGDLKIVSIDNGQSFNDASTITAINNVGQLGMSSYVDSFLRDNPEAESAVENVITEWADNLRAWIESTKNKKFTDGGLSFDEMNMRRRAISNYLYSLLDSLPSGSSDREGIEYWLELVRYGGSGANEGNKPPLTYTGVPDYVDDIFSEKDNSHEGEF